MNLNVTVQNEPLRETNGAEAQMDPVQTNAGLCKEGAEDVIYRALALRHMELPVGDFITDALKKNVPIKRGSYYCQTSRTKRTMTSRSVTLRTLTEQMMSVKEALRLRQAWIEHPDHTIVKAMVAERAIFFVLLPLFRACGDAGMRTVSADISRDEQVHVATNSLVEGAWTRYFALTGSAEKSHYAVGVLQPSRYA